MSVSIIGIGTGYGLTSEALDVLQQAHLIIGGTRQLELVEEHSRTAEKWDLTGRLKDIVGLVSTGIHEEKSIAILASGDPMYFGIGGYLVDKLRKVNIEPAIFTAPSAISVAASRFGVKWNDAHRISI